MSEGLGEEGPHDSIAGKQQASAQQPQGDVELERNREREKLQTLVQTSKMT